MQEVKQVAGRQQSLTWRQSNAVRGTINKTFFFSKSISDTLITWYPFKERCPHFILAYRILTQYQIEFPLQHLMCLACQSQPCRQYKDHCEVCFLNYILLFPVNSLIPSLPQEGDITTIDSKTKLGELWTWAQLLNSCFASRPAGNNKIRLRSKTSKRRDVCATRGSCAGGAGYGKNTE